MIKSFLILISFSTLLLSSQQIILVVADDFNTSTAQMECYEDGNLIFKNIRVNLGKNGLGWGLGLYKFKIKEHEPKKYEGDKKAPAGIFKLTQLFGYSKSNNYKMPYLYASKKLICIDDTNSPFYNHIIEAHGDEKSFESMRREDEQYKIGIVVAHNPDALAKRGSCIFLHIERERNKGTAGCTSMRYKELQAIITWLDKKKNPLLIQIPSSYAHEVIKLYPQLKNSKLLTKKD
jgi:hypothetical protein